MSSARPIPISQLRTEIRNMLKVICYWNVDCKTKHTFLHLVQQLDVDGDGNVSLMEYVDYQVHATDDAKLLKELENDAKIMLNKLLPVARYMY